MEDEDNLPQHARVPHQVLEAAINKYTALAEDDTPILIHPSSYADALREILRLREIITDYAEDISGGFQT